MNRSAVLIALALALAVPATASAAAEGRIVFRHFDPVTKKVRLYTVRPDGTGERALTLPKGAADQDSQPDWSPNGRYVVFRRFVTPERTDVMRIRRDGTGLVNLTRSSCDGKCLGSEEPAVSPDGERIAFNRAIGPFGENDGPPAKVGLFVMNADGSGVRQLTQRKRFSGTEDHAATWSPDGTKLAFMRDVQATNASAVLTVNVASREVARLRRMPKRWPGAGAPDWSPDGRHILYTTYCYFGPCGQPSRGAQLFVMRADGTAAHKVTHVRGNAYNGRWSPDGGRIVFASNPRLGPTGDVYTARADGSHVHRVTHAAKRDNHQPDWGPPTS
jgi:Tol biopolymer transport system component